MRVLVWYVEHVDYSRDFGSVRFDCSTARYMPFLNILHNFFVSYVTKMLDLIADRSQVLFFAGYLPLIILK